MYTNPLDVLRDEELAKRGLPEVAYIDNSWDKSAGAAPVIAVKRGEAGYYPIHTAKSADELNGSSGVTAAQREAMHIGSMMGWHVPGSFPSAHGKIRKI